MSRGATLCAVGLGLVCGLLAPPASAQPKPAPLPAAARAVLERFAGTWDVTLTVLKPQPATVTYVLTSAWVLDHRFLRGESSVKSDGSQELSMFTYDPVHRTYPLSVYYSSGLVAYLQHGEWDESTRTMEWKSGAADPIQFKSRCAFDGGALLRCATQVRSGVGGTAVELQSVARRR